MDPVEFKKQPAAQEGISPDKKDRLLGSEGESIFDALIERRGTGSAKYDKDRLLQDPDLLPLWVADMDFQSPKEVLEAIHARTEHGIFGYPSRDEDYFEAVVEWMKRRHHLDIEKEWIIPFPGVVAALRVCIQAFTKPDDGVIILSPVYYPFTLVVEQAEREVLRCPLLLEEDQDRLSYKIDFAHLEELMEKPEAKMLIFCSPHNPIGRCWDREELEKISALALKHNVLVISDEIHMDFVYEKEFVSFYHLDSEARENTILCTAPSKTFNLAGLRCSNVIIENKKLFDQFSKTMQLGGVEAPSILSMEACKAAYRYGDKWLDELKDYLKGNYALMKDYFEQKMPMLKIASMEALYLVWVDFRALGLTKEELEEFMLKKAHLWLDEGYVFGPEGEGFERFNLTLPRSGLKKALDQLYLAMKEEGLLEKQA